MMATSRAAFAPRRGAGTAAATAVLAGALSEQAKTSFETIATVALARGLAPEGESAQVVPIDDLPRRMKEKKAVVLSIASDRFRLVVALLCRLDADGKAHFARLNRIDPAEWSDQDFEDAVNECGNIIVGSINRDVGRYFPSVGMSTPNVLDREALAYLEALGPGHRRVFQVTGLSLDFFAVLFVSPTGAVDFRAEVEALEDAVDSGELEMF
jgi:hypothetical protein